jgi:hypothetical protein
MPRALPRVLPAMRFSSAGANTILVQFDPDVDLFKFNVNNNVFFVKGSEALSQVLREIEKHGIAYASAGRVWDEANQFKVSHSTPIEEVHAHSAPRTTHR